MLSNAELILLKFIKTKPYYAYELERLIDDRQLRQWVKISGATIYQVLDRLCQKGLLEYTFEKEGNMPQRKRYHISSKGDEIFFDSTREILQNIEPYYFNLSIGLSCRKFLEKEEFDELIEVRLKKLESFLEDFNKRFEKSKELYPTKRLIIREYLLSHYKLEEELLKKLLSKEEDINE
ncbi:PadR family transcriptional regulator [Clostridium akagii]|uniref:PadR family transcriptional regulator n=1 Tax=Clostridium akagii TaxID=91623 RepID=UPI000478A1CF|nr:PadR family transcriptional regulator [Clostridium akagii]